MIKQTKASVRDLSGQDAFFYFYSHHFNGEMEQGNQRILKRRSENGNEIFKGE